tara:strand:+ start:12386 stop:13084 length:699 start_codon:yes stop_codon:yes gene_type:complete
MNAIVTGASRGLGLAIARMLASSGFNLFLLAKNEERLQTVKAQIENDFKTKVTTFASDFSNEVDTNTLVQKLSAAVPKVDVLVNNIGAFEMGDMTEVSHDQVNKLLNINFATTFKITQAYLSEFKNSKAGFIFNIGSIVTELPRKDLAAYTISKFALQGYTKMLCDDLKDHGVKVTEIVPGSINTSSWDGIDAPKEEFIQTKDIVDTIEMVINSSKGVNFEQIIIRPTNRNF